MLFGTSIKCPPCEEPDKTNRTRDDECGAPSILECDDRNDEWCNEGANVGAGVEDSCGEGTLFFGKPLSDCLNGRREVSRFAKAEEEASDTKAKHSMRECVAHRRKAPEDDRERESFARADAIDQTSDAEQPNRVCGLERKDDPTVTDFGPTDFNLKRWLKDSDHLAIDVIDRCREEQKGTDDPAKFGHG